MTLIGAEGVKLAGNAIQEAAGEMSRAADSMRESVENHRRYLEEHDARVLQTFTEGIASGMGTAKSIFLAGFDASGEQCGEGVPDEAGGLMAWEAFVREHRAGPIQPITRQGAR